jgi:hypothetical protein
VSFNVSDAARAVAMEVRAGRGGTLVISEAYLPTEPTTGYNLGQYIEVHNNGFETVYLDGKVLGRSLPWVSGTLETPCDGFARWLEDPEGIWSRFFWAFPGTGRTYPLPPGGSAIVATDAIDHRSVNANLLDLSRADFEFIGASDVDNPAVPNMRNSAGWSDMRDPYGHGPRWYTEISVFLADPFDPDSLVRDNLPVASPLHVRIPRDRILDVLTSGVDRSREPAYPYCPNFVHPSFDGGYARLVNGSMAYSIVRRPFVEQRLQRTKVSAVDFQLAPPTPGRVP